MYISICVQGLNKFLKFFWSKFQPGDCSQLVLNFWANLSLSVLTKFVLIKKKACIQDKTSYMKWQKIRFRSNDHVNVYFLSFYVQVLLCIYPNRNNFGDDESQISLFTT